MASTQKAQLQYSEKVLHLFSKGELGEFAEDCDTIDNGPGKMLKGPLVALLSQIMEI